MVCPLCENRRARRSCPAVGQQICAVCCGTKRLVQIQCPADCPYLASAREHPAAVVVRLQQRDVAFVAQGIRDLSDRQSELFFLIATTLIGKRGPGLLQSLIDEDVIYAMTAMAGTLETASRGVIYEHRPASLAAERLAATLKPVIAEAGRGLGSAFERDAAGVMRRIADVARDARAGDPENRRAFVDLLERVLPQTGRPDESDAPADPAAASPSRLIVP